MSPDGVAATIIEKSFRKMAANENLQYKVGWGLNLVIITLNYMFSFLCVNILFSRQVSMSYLQIYQEKIYDLLNNAASSKIDLTIREHPQRGM
jgi:hypothetical protein